MRYDPFDPWRELRRLLEGARPVIEQFERQRKEIERFTDSARIAARKQDQELTALREAARPALEQYAAQQREIRQLASHLTISDLARNLGSTWISSKAFFDCDALVAAARPFAVIDPVGTIADTIRPEFIADYFNRLNDSISAARYLGQVDVEFDDEPVSKEQSDTERIAEKLVEIVSPETLSELRRVEFAPIMALDRALRSPELMRMLGAREFEGFIAALIEQLGFEDVQLTPRSADRGRDVLATKKVSGIPIVFAFECKRYSPHRAVGPAIARALLGTIRHSDTQATKGVLVTTSYFSPSAARFILTEPSLDGKDFEGIVSWLKDYGKGKRD